MMEMLQPKTSKRPLMTDRQAGMSLLEVIFSISILLVLALTSATMIRSGIDKRIALSEQGRVTHRLEAAMQTITRDLQHVFMIDRRHIHLNYSGRATKSLFEMRTRGGNSTLRFTTMSRQPMREHAHESDQSFVIYEVEEDRETGLSNLYRGETPVIPQNFADDVPMRLLAKYIKRLEITLWDGDRWVDAWNSDGADTRDLIPHMVQIELETWEVNLLDDERAENIDRLPTSTIRSVVYIPASWGVKERRQSSTSLRYY